MHVAFKRITCFLHSSSDGQKSKRVRRGENTKTSMWNFPVISSNIPWISSGFSSQHIVMFQGNPLGEPHDTGVEVAGRWHLQGLDLKCYSWVSSTDGYDHPPGWFQTLVSLSLSLCMNIYIYTVYIYIFIDIHVYNCSCILYVYISI